MPSTPYIEATSFVVNDETINNPENLLGSSDGDATMVNDSEIVLTFPNLSSYIPSNATVTGVSVKYSGTPTSISLLTQLLRHLVLTNPNVLGGQNIPISLGSDVFLPSQVNDSIVYETPNASSLLNTITATQTQLGVAPILTSGIKTGLTTFSLKLTHVSYESSGYNGTFVLDGDGVPAMQITYTQPEAPKTKIKIQSNVKVKLTGNKILINN